MRTLRHIGITVLLLTVLGCTSSYDSCDDLEGTVTHTVTELTGIESASISKRNPITDTVDPVDPLDGIEYSNIVIEIDMSWIEEQYRFRAPNTFIQSLLDIFISPAMACSLSPYYEAYTPVVTSVEIYSDNDFNKDLVAGNDLTNIFSIKGVVDQNTTPFGEIDAGELVSSKKYVVTPAFLNGEPAAIPITPNSHIFTIMVLLDDGRAYEIRSPEVQLTMM